MCLPNARRGLNPKHLLSLKWPVAFGHGDLSKGNMLRDSSGKLFIVDWEVACMMPVACDLQVIYAGCPDMRGDILNILAVLSENEKSVVPPEMQMVMALGARTASIKIKINEHMEYIKHVYGKDVTEAYEFIERKIVRNQELMVELVDSVGSTYRRSEKC